MDSLTGLSTYRVLRDRLAFEVERSKRSNEGFAVLFLDLDRFKEVNDQLRPRGGQRDPPGGGRGDPARGACVGRGGPVRGRRVRGDPDPDRPAGRRRGWPRRCGPGSRAWVGGWGIRPGSVTVSIGLAEFEHGQPEGDLLVAADRALYRAKAAGRNAVA